MCHHLGGGGEEGGKEEARAVNPGAHMYSHIVYHASFEPPLDREEAGDSAQEQVAQARLKHSHKRLIASTPSSRFINGEIVNGSSIVKRASSSVGDYGDSRPEVQARCLNPADWLCQRPRRTEAAQPPTSHPGASPGPAGPRGDPWAFCHCRIISSTRGSGMR